LNIEYSQPVIFTNLFEVVKFTKSRARENFGFYSTANIMYTFTTLHTLYVKDSQSHFRILK